ncbi:hypothetical protein QBZ16_000200 [Prototheca wickerhamii]|uniref:Uncharacterized protein n=1 Tax=Prototheca wickerhamii TaxID=3111 RepID=A0AAD9IP74_PROWI|nr:hypothetical protein QBZ16_000200 [Prototheca wickerhamii]
MGQKASKSSHTNVAVEGDTSAHDKALKAATGGRWGHDTGLSRNSTEVQAALSSAADPDAVEAKEKHEQAKLAAQGGRWGESHAAHAEQAEQEKVRDARSKATGGRW